MPPLADRHPTHAGRHQLQAVIKGCRRYLFIFLANRAIPPTNNGSERGLRPCVVFRKVTNCFRSQSGAKLYADIRSVVETARRRSIGALKSRRFSREFKVSAVNRLLAGENVSALARELNVLRKDLDEWRDRFRACGPDCLRPAVDATGKLGPGTVDGQ